MVWLYIFLLLFNTQFIKTSSREINGGGLKTPWWLIWSPTRIYGKCWVLLRRPFKGKLFISSSCNYFDRGFENHFKLWDRFIFDSTYIYSSLDSLPALRPAKQNRAAKGKGGGDDAVHGIALTRSLLKQCPGA